MTAWFYIFILSLAGIITLLGVRLFENKRGLPRFLVSLRDILNRSLVRGLHFVRHTLLLDLQRRGQEVVEKAQELRRHPTLRRGVKLGITILARTIHDLIVAVLRILGRMRKWVLTLHDRHSD